MKTAKIVSIKKIEKIKNNSFYKIKQKHTFVYILPKFTAF